MPRQFKRPLHGKENYSMVFIIECDVLETKATANSARAKPETITVPLGYCPRWPRQFLCQRSDEHKRHQSFQWLDGSYEYAIRALVGSRFIRDR